MDQLFPVLILAAVFLGILTLMYVGWRGRGKRQSTIPAPAPDAPIESIDGDTAAGPFDAVYVSTVLADKPFERVVAHGLGTRSRARLTRGTAGSWRIEREGAPSFTIPGDQVLDVAAAPGMAGKVVGGDGLLVIRWHHGPDATELDTGLRLTRRADHDLLLRKDPS